MEKESVKRRRLPNATAVLVLGVASIALCCCYGLPGIVTGIISLTLYNKDRKKFEEADKNSGDINNLKTGRMLSIIGISMSSLYIVYLIFAYLYFGSEALSNPKLMIEKLKNW